MSPVNQTAENKKEEQVYYNGIILCNLRSLCHHIK